MEWYGIAASQVALPRLGGAVLSALAVVAVVAAGMLVSRLLTRLIRKAFDGSSMGGVTIIVNIARSIVLAVVVYLVGENIFHIELGGVIQALGITTLVVSLGLQDLIKNVVAGIEIVMTHQLTVGDQVEVGGKRGEVTDVNWRQTTMRDKDGDPHVIPNSVLMGGAFVRRIGKMARRYVIECDIKPGLDLQRVAEDIEQLADKVLSENGWRAEEGTEVRFLGSTANGVSTSIRIFLVDIEYTTRAMDAVMRAIGQRGYLADWTNEAPLQERWR